MKKNTMTNSFLKAGKDMSERELKFYAHVAQQIFEEMSSFVKVHDRVGLLKSIHMNLLTAYAHGKMDEDTRDAIISGL